MAKPDVGGLDGVTHQTAPYEGRKTPKATSPRLGADLIALYKRLDLR